MNDIDIVTYLEGHAPLHKFYLYVPSRGDLPLLKFMDGSGKLWNLMEDDETIAMRSAQVLEKHGAPIFRHLADLIDFENRKRSTALVNPPTRQKSCGKRPDLQQ